MILLNPPFNSLLVVLLTTTCKKKLVELEDELIKVWGRKL